MAPLLVLFFMVAYPFPSATTEALVDGLTERLRRLYSISTLKMIPLKDQLRVFILVFIGQRYLLALQCSSHCDSRFRKIAPITGGINFG